MSTDKVPRSFCWTLNNPTEEEYNTIVKITPADFSYMVFGHETGENGTPHLQGYAECLKQMRKSGLKKYGLYRAHYKARGGTPMEAAGYCKKGTDPKDDVMGWTDYFCRTTDEPGTWHMPFEIGTISEQGKRTDITQVVESIQGGDSMCVVARTFPEQYVKYHRGFHALRSQLLEPRNLHGAPEVVVLWGPTNTGKSRDARIKYWPDEPYYVWRPSNGKWWDGYDGEMKIIIEEYRGDLDWSDILGLLDRNDFLAPVKGGFIHIQADKFVITSPEPPERWYHGKYFNHFDKYEQLTRRLTHVHCYGS